MTDNYSKCELYKNKILFNEFCCNFDLEKGCNLKKGIHM